ncbi:MAG: nitrogenase component 1 [Megasphaera sp.]|jgi:nitrogenase molybdenum-iron protein alpha/beta subunit|nr:nitrogenase component 1 [Megasphaera sp.]MCH4188330.1 nitrogenase component 1 [Megasphaera sp.]MCH4218189.1 nitrogenase component 1 [Megasphaera sp.]
MKGLWKYIAPFAPDQSGAAAVLYGLGGIVVICDAGGCAGNICGFDEPRWFSGKKSAVFSAGLRDMDAILGRDDRLVHKLCAAAQEIDAAFAAIVGTPVPSVIATDYTGLRRMAEKQLSIPVLTIDTTGMTTYDTGIIKAFHALLETFTDRTVQRKKGVVNVLGAIPLDMRHPADLDCIRPRLRREGWDTIRLGDTLDDYIHAGEAEKNIALSPAGLAAAQWLQRTFGTPYECRYFGLETLVEQVQAVQAKKILIIHQQIGANALREMLEGTTTAAITVATWFLRDEGCCCDGDIQLREEDDFCVLADNDEFDCIIGDAYFKKALPHFKGTFIDFPHFAVSGRT